MGHLYDDNHVYEAYNDRRSHLDSITTGYGSTLLAIIAGSYVVFKALEILGFPVWLWLHMAAERIGTLQLRGAGSPSQETSSDEKSQNTDMQRGGNMLSSVFGLGSSGLLQKGVRGVTGALAKSSSDVPPGLGNWDNSCYQNSVIQGLASLPSLRDYLSKTTVEHRNLDTETTNGALFDMISKLNDPENRGQNFWIRGKLKSMSTFQQQDAQEYYSKILDALEKEVQGASNKKRRSSASWINAAKNLSDVSAVSQGDEVETPTAENREDAQPSEQPKMDTNPLDGLLAQRVGCINCGYSEGLQLIPFNCVTVSLGRNWAYDIGDCLDEYTNLEYIEGVECAKCTLLKLKDTLSPLVAGGAPFQARLQAVEEAIEDDDFDDKTLVKKFNILKKNWVQSTKSRQAVVARAPKALVLHVNRSIFDEMTGAQYKNSANVSYPKILDLGNWCLGSQPSESRQSNNAAEEWPRDPTKSMLGGPNAEPVTNSPFQYKLRSVVTHFGTHGNGHYVCYRPHPTKGGSPLLVNGTEAKDSPASEQWWRFSDDSVYTVSEQQAHQGNVFMLFYERIDDLTTTTQEEDTPAPQEVYVTENSPLPPANISLLSPSVIDDTAAEVPLPDDDEESLPDLINSTDVPTPPATLTGPSTPELRAVTPPNTKPADLHITAYLTPPPETPPSMEQSDTENSEAETENTLSAQDEDTPSDSKVTPQPMEQPKIAPSPHLMRTAGESPARGGNRRSLPMVTAT